jgi:DNA-binding NtrC family response regulator
MQKHILLIDDDKEDLPVFLDALRQVRADYGCMQTSDIVQAAKFVNYLKPVAIFLDYNMSGLNVLDSLQAIKRTEELRYIPLYMYGNLPISNKSFRTAISFGAKAMIHRTRNSKLLAAILKKILRINQDDDLSRFSGY